MLSCRLIEDGSGIAEIAGAWDRLLCRSEFTTIFASAGFARAWWRAYGHHRRLRLLVVEDEMGPRLIAPLYCDASSPDDWKMIGNFRGDYGNLIFSAGDVESLSCLFAWLRTHAGWQTLSMHNLPGHAAVLRFFPRAYTPDARYATKLRSWLVADSPLICQEWHAQHPRADAAKLRELAALLESRNHRKHVNWFSRQGTLAYRCLAEPADIRSRLPEFFALHVAEWSSKGGRSLFLEPANRDFYGFLTEDLAAYRTLRLDLLTVGDRLIAAHLGFDWHGRVSYYKPCYDPAVASHSPGKLLLAHIIRRAAEAGAPELDLLFGLEDYKKQYASEIRATGSIVMERSRWRALRRRLRPVSGVPLAR